MSSKLPAGEGIFIPPPLEPSGNRYVAWFHELDTWTEYWDIYHPETHGRYYFGDGKLEDGLLTRFLPRTSYPPPWIAWKNLALSTGSPAAFIDEVRKPDVAAAIVEVDSLVGRVFGKYFGNPADPDVQSDYLEAAFRFAIDALPPASERESRIANDDWRKPSSGRHTLDSDAMWFAWALELEAAHAIAGDQSSRDHDRRALLLAGVATGCAANFAWRGHRRTRAEYRPTLQTASLLRKRGMRWATDFGAAASEVHSLFRIREWGHD